MRNPLETCAAFAFLGAPCPDCRRPLRLVGGGLEFDGLPRGPRRRQDDYRCEQGHAFHVTVERLATGAIVTSALQRYTQTGAAHVHFA